MACRITERAYYENRIGLSHLKEEHSAIQSEVKVFLSSSAEGRPGAGRVAMSGEISEWQWEGVLSVVTTLSREQGGFVRFEQHAIRVLTVAQRF